MNELRTIGLSKAWAAGLLLLLPWTVAADGESVFVVYDREQGELSPGTSAPSLHSMVEAVDGATPLGLTAMLEYGERVECFECIPKLEAKLLGSNDASVREISAWWLRRRPFGYARAAVKMRDAVQNDADPVRRARAAEALGEFLDAGGVPALQAAIASDDDASVRLAAVRALGRMNARSGQEALVSAFADDSVKVRRAALDQVQRESFFDDQKAIIDRLEDEDARVRLRAAQLVGELGIEAGREALEHLLAKDDSSGARQAAAWSLGKLGAARSVLIAARDAEQEPGVLDAIEVALRMQR